MDDVQRARLETIRTWANDGQRRQNGEDIRFLIELIDRQDAVLDGLTTAVNYAATARRSRRAVTSLSNWANRKTG